MNSRYKFKDKYIYLYNFFLYFFFDDCKICVLNSNAKYRNKIDIEKLKTR